MAQPQAFAKVTTVAQPLWQEAALLVGAGVPAASLPDNALSALFEKAVLVMRPSLQEQRDLATDLEHKRAFVTGFARIYMSNLPPFSHIADRLTETA